MFYLRLSPLLIEPLLPIDDGVMADSCDAAVHVVLNTNSWALSLADTFFSHFAFVIKI